MYALTAFFSAAALLVVRLNPFLGVAVILLALGVFIFWAKKLGVMREVVLPASERMRNKKELAEIFHCISLFYEKE